MTDPTEFSRAFALAFGSGQAKELAALFGEDAAFHSLTSQFLEGRPAIERGLSAEFAGMCRAARLVSGKTNLRKLGPGASILHQRFVVSGLQDEAGQELPRVVALLTAVLAATENGWQALTATFALVEP